MSSKISLYLLLISALAFSSSAFSENKLNDIVDADINAFFEKLSVVDKKIFIAKCDYKEIQCVKETLLLMVEKDQLARHFWEKPGKKPYKNSQILYFNQKFMSVLQKIDTENTTKLKEILKIHDWVNISKFGKNADDDAWLLVQHADLDPMFQNQVLDKLTKLFPKKETNPTSYAYLYDRVKTNGNQPQLYGTQILCKRDEDGKLVIKPYPIEKKESIDKRRKEVGMEIVSFKDYFAKVKDLCASQFS